MGILLHPEWPLEINGLSPAFASVTATRCECSAYLYWLAGTSIHFSGEGYANRSRVLSRDSNDWIGFYWLRILFDEIFFEFVTN